MGTVTFATMLKELRAKLGFSQREMAAALHVSRDVISRWERGTSEPALPGYRQERKQ
jgi:transcriptional regulator with XRE-family HTH domain